MRFKASVRSLCSTSLLVPALALSVSVATAGQSAPQQQAPDQGSTTPAGYTDIVVTAPRMDLPYRESPGATSVVGRETLGLMPKGISAGEALPLVPGVKVETQYDSEKVHLSIRGQGILTEVGIRGIQVLLDGIPLNDPSGFAPDLYDVDWSTVQRVEVIRGPSGAFYGGGSSAGVVNIVTKDGRTEPDRADLLGVLGTYNFWKALGEVAGTTANGDYRLSVSRTMGDGNRDHSNFFGTNFYGKARLVIDPTFHVTAVVMGTDYFNENPEGLNTQQVAENPRQANPDSAAFNEFYHTKRVTAGLVGAAQIATNQSLDFTVYGRSTDYVESVPDTVGHQTLNNPGAMVQYALTTGHMVRNRFSAGVDAGWQSIDDYKQPNLGGAVQAPYRVSDQTVTQRGLGLYLMDRIEFNPRWALLLNLRHDGMRFALDDHLRSGGVDLSGSRDFNKTSGRAGLTWNPTPDFGLYASIGQGFTPPSTDELNANPDHVGGFNGHLQPATSVGEELGVRGRVGDRLAYEATGFYMTTSDDFERYRVPGRPLETFYGNEGDSRRYGLETALGWYPAEGLAVRFQYTYNHFTYSRITSNVFPTAQPGDFLPNSPEHQGFLDVEYRPVDAWVIGGGLDSQSRSYVDPTNVPYIGGYTLFHARVAYSWKTLKSRGEVMLSGTNLGNKKYIAFTEPDPDGNSYQPGPGSQVFVGVHLWFGGK